MKSNIFISVESDHIGCFIENSGEYDRQWNPSRCYSREECQCPSQYPFVGYTNGDTDQGRAEWSCFMELPPTTAEGCQQHPTQDWYFGARGWKASVYKNPNYSGK